jgi:hypothetical protein
MSEGHVHHQWHHVVPGHGVSQFMERVQVLVDGGPPPAELPMVMRAPRSIADANDEWVAQRAMAEQVVSEANAVLGPDRAHLELEDEVGRPELTFVLRGPAGWLRVTMRSERGLAWIGCESSLPDVPEGVELAEPQAFEDVVLRLLAG